MKKINNFKNIIKRLDRTFGKFNLYLLSSIVLSAWILFFSIAKGVETQTIMTFNPHSHIISYFMLSLSLSLHFLSNNSINALLRAALIAGFYGILIELIQLFIPYRSFQIFDIFLNFVGSFSVFIVYLLLIICRRIK